MNIKESVFISYAWGGPLVKKEWFRQQIVNPLDLVGFDVFWDRDIIEYGQKVDDVIAKALSARPIRILCICDNDYVASALQEDSGLYRELKLIAKIVDLENVRLIPVILDNKCKDSLPDIFNGRTYLDLTKLHARRLTLGFAIVDMICGRSQAKVESGIALQLRRAELKEKADIYIRGNPFHIYGNPNTHEVWINDRELLLPPAWMAQSSLWSDRVSENIYKFCPKEGIWAWHHGGASSTGMQMLGAAIVSALFLDKSSPQDIALIEWCGKIIADKILIFYEDTEMFSINGSEIIDPLLREGAGVDVLSKLLE